jgi:hypothetical protein
VVIGIRRQDQWLASRYAESSKDFPGLDQSDFDRRMHELAKREVLDGPLAWLDYAAVRQEFSAALGRENLLLVPLEWIGARPEETIRQLEGFCGLTPGDAWALKPSRQARNPLSKGPNTWRMRRSGKMLHLDPVHGPDTIQASDSLGELTSEGIGVVWQWPSPNVPGVYRILRDQEVVQAVPIVISAEESNLESLPPDVLKNRLAAGRSVSYQSAAGLSHREQDRWWIWLLTACVVCMLGELTALISFRT